jgi:hypothetical protein
MDSFEAKAKHLEMIQVVVGRMASNLFYLKGWATTLVAALFALAAKDSNVKLVVISYFPVLIFWALDGYFLSQERLFRALYDDVRAKANADIDFSMDTSQFRYSPKNTWAMSTLSPTLTLFYGPIIMLMIGLMFYILR